MNLGLVLPGEDLGRGVGANFERWLHKKQPPHPTKQVRSDGSHRGNYIVNMSLRSQSMLSCVHWLQKVKLGDGRVPRLRQTDL